MKREAKKPGRRKPSARRAGTPAKSIRAGGDVVGGDKNVAGGDVVGRDKLVAGDDIIQAGQYVERQIINIPRSVQVAAVVAAAAVVVIAVAILTRSSQPIDNGTFELRTLNGWDVGGAIQVVATGESKDSPVGEFAAQLPIGASLQQSVTVSVQQPQLTLYFRSPPGGVAHGTLNVYLNDVPRLAVMSAAVGAPQWNVAVADLSAYAGQEVRLRIEYAQAVARAGGRLHTLALQNGDVLWLDNIAIVPRDELVKIAEPTAIPSPPAPTRTPARPVPSGPLNLFVEESSKGCKDSTYYEIVFSISAEGGTPPYTYSRDQEKIGGPTRTGLTYPLSYGEHSAATGTFVVVDSANQSDDYKFFSAALDCP